MSCNRGGHRSVVVMCCPLLIRSGKYEALVSINHLQIVTSFPKLNKVDLHILQSYPYFTIRHLDIQPTGVEMSPESCPTLRKKT